MKKVLIVFFLVIILCGCGSKDNKYKNYDHYDLSRYNYKPINYTRDKTGPWHDIVEENYAVAVLVEDYEKVEGYEEGLLYKVGENDYILLDSFLGCETCYNIDGYNYLYKDKLYVKRETIGIYEYTLNKEKTEKKKLEFNYDLIFDNYKELNPTKYLTGYKIDEVNDEYIFFKGAYIYNIPNIKINMKCSLKDLICEEYKK